MKRALSILAALAAGCGTSDEARVSIDLAALWDAAGQISSGGRSVVVSVYDNGGNYVTGGSLADTDPASSVDLAVPLGTGWRFEVEATEEDAATMVYAPTYWGEATVDIPTPIDVALTVPIFPAGKISGRVTVGGAELLLPDGVKVVATADDPRPDAPAAREVDGSWGYFELTLPTGLYAVTVEATAYALASGGGPMSVVQGEIVDLPLDLSPL